LVFPSSNGYNSCQDRDTTSIGGLKNPPPVSSKLYYTTLFLDILSIGASLFISVLFTVFVFAFILISHAYSYRPIRLKRYPFISFFTVSVFQGAVVYLMSLIAIENHHNLAFISSEVLMGMAISTLFMGSIYPLTQIYQHEADRTDGVISLSYKLGYIGTFVFSAILFLLATLCVFMYFRMAGNIALFLLFQLITLPVIIWFLIWFIKVIRSRKQANFENAMCMNLVTSVCMNIYFLFLFMNHYGNWI
jgi:1,4-dihydroxy-2-naphthoate octaprenyltransferase